MVDLSKFVNSIHSISESVQGNTMSPSGKKNEIGSEESMRATLTTADDVLELMKQEKVELVDCCFTDPLGMWQHCTFMAEELDEAAFDEGLPFDGSSIKLFSEIHHSDLLMKPDPTTAWIDPFYEKKTLHIACTVREPGAKRGFARDPRTIAMKALEYLKSTDIADTCFIGPEAEFFVFDDVQYGVSVNSASFFVDGIEAEWNGVKPGASGAGNLGHRAEMKGYYFPVAPLDRHHNLRSDMLLTMRDIGLPVEKHHHEVATCQSELGFRAMTLVQAADSIQAYKYIVKNVAAKHGKSATFMPKPLKTDNGSGMHIHQSLWKGGKPLFFDANGNYANLSETALQYIGGILHHAPALCAFGNPSTNSYKRLVPGFEAPVNLVYSQGNRSAAVRIPMYHPTNPKVKRLEFRCADPLANPYLIFTACLMAGLDGIKRKIFPGAPMDVDMYELTPKERKNIRSTPGSLSEALSLLEGDMEFLLEGDVFTRDFLEAFIQYKREEVRRYETTPHPLEFLLYYQG
jgi:glutamine synthetase